MCKEMNAIEQRLRDQMESHPEHARLYDVPEIACSGAMLYEMQCDITQVFADPAVDASWYAAAAQLEALDIPDQTGGVNPGDRRALFYLAEFFRPATVLEIGTHIGASTTHIAAAMKSYAGSLLTTVDIVDVNDEREQAWLKYGATRSPQQMISSLNCDGLVRFRRSDGKEFLRQTAHMYDMIFLDGDHHAAATYQEMALALGRLKSGGFIVLHDYYSEMKPLWQESAPIMGPYLASQRILAQGCSMSILPLAALPWPTKHGTCLTSLAMVLGPSRIAASPSCARAAVYHER